MGVLVSDASRTLAIHLGMVIRTERQRQKLRLADLSLLSGVAVATLSDLENGVRDTRLSSYQRVLDALGVRTADLFVGTNEPHAKGQPNTSYDLGDAL